MIGSTTVVVPCPVLWLSSLPLLHEGVVVSDRHLSRHVTAMALYALARGGGLSLLYLERVDGWMDGRLDGCSKEPLCRERGGLGIAVRGTGVARSDVQVASATVVVVVLRGSDVNRGG